MVSPVRLRPSAYQGIVPVALAIMRVIEYDLERGSFTGEPPS